MGRSRASHVLKMISYAFIFVFVLVLLCFYMSWKSFKFGKTMNTEYLN